VEREPTLALSNTQLKEPGSARPDGETLLTPRVGTRRAIERAVLIQFVQFCLVGAFSTALNEVLFNLFWAWGLGINPSYVLAFSLAVTNGFFLNRAWTFRRSRTHKMERQYVMFIAVNLVGLALSWAVMRLVGAWLLHSGWAAALVPVVERMVHQPAHTDRLAYSLGVLAATPPCAVWNFSANKLWTFGSR
jgi:putative flippase GtrA